MNHLNNNAVEIRELKSAIAKLQGKIEELESCATEHGWYKYTQLPNEVCYFNMVNGHVKEMVSVCQGHVIVPVDGCKMLMAAVNGWTTNDSLQGCYPMYYLNKYKAAAEAMEANPVEIARMSHNMALFRTRCFMP